MDSHYKLQGMNMNSMDAPGNSMEIHGVPRISMEVFHTGAVASHVVVVARHDFKLTFFPVSQILCKCFFIGIGSDHLYVGLAPNKIESD